MNEYLITMKPMIYLMKLICALPLNLEPEDEVPHFITSKVVSFLTAVMCIFFYLHIGYYMIYALMDKSITHIIIKIVAKGPEIIIHSFCLTVPFHMWSRNHQLQDYWKAWKHFQLEYEIISGVPFISRKRKHVKIVSLICVTWSISRSFYALWFHYYIYISITEFMIDIYVLFTLYVIAMYWFADCTCFRSVSEDILILGKKIIAEKKQHDKMNKLVSLWLNVNTLANQFNDGHSFLFLTFFITIVLTIITSAYALMNYSIYKIVYPFTYYANILIIFVIFLLLICETAYSVNHQMNYRQKEALLQENTMMIETKTLQSVSRFLQTVSTQDLNINLNGFLTLNRVEFPVIVSVCINYLIVLRQFSEDEPVICVKK